MANVEEESRNAHVERQKFEEETIRIQAEMKATQDQFDFLSANIELEKNRCVKLASENFNHKQKVAKLYFIRSHCILEFFILFLIRLWI